MSCVPLLTNPQDWRYLCTKWPASHIWLTGNRIQAQESLQQLVAGPFHEWLIEQTWLKRCTKCQYGVSSLKSLVFPSKMHMTAEITHLFQLV